MTERPLSFLDSRVGHRHSVDIIFGIEVPALRNDVLWKIFFMDTRARKCQLLKDMGDSASNRKLRITQTLN